MTCFFSNKIKSYWLKLAKSKDFINTITLSNTKKK